MEKTCEDYEQLYSSYPDVVNLVQFREMLGGISECAARKMMKENRVRHYFIRHAYLIPKLWVIDYIRSKHDIGNIAQP